MVFLWGQRGQIIPRSCAGVQYTQNMPEFLLVALTVIVLFAFWPRAGQAVDGWSLGGAFFLAGPLGAVLTQTHLAFWGWMLLAFAVWVMAQWLRDKWRTQ